MKLTQTTTPVHDHTTQIQQRWETYLSDQYKLSSLCLLGQFWLCHSLLLMESTASSAWLCALLSILPFAFIHLWARTLSRRAADEKSMCTSLLPHFQGRVLEWLMACSLLLDAIFLLCGLTSLLGELLPAIRRFFLAPIVGILCLSTLVRNRPYALIRLSGFLFLPLLLALPLSVSPALDQGNINNLRPLFGPGTASALSGVVYLTGCAGTLCLPLLMPGERNALKRMRSKGKQRGSLLLMIASLLIALVFLFYAYLMPPRMLAQPLSMGKRLLLPVQISSSVPGWTLYVCALILLLMISYTGAVTRCCTFFYGNCTQAHHSPDWLITLIIALSLPPAMFFSDSMQNLLILLLPFRVLPYLLALLLSSCGACLQFIRGRKTV